MSKRLGKICTERASHKNKERSLHKFVSGNEGFLSYFKILLSTANT